MFINFYVPVFLDNANTKMAFISPDVVNLLSMPKVAVNIFLRSLCHGDSLLNKRATIALRAIVARHDNCPK